MPATQSRIALSLLNLLLAAVQTGFGPFVSVWLTENGWSQGDIGIALSVGTVAGLIGQLPAGALIDATNHKRLAAACALVVLAISALMLALFPEWLPVLGAQALHGLASCVLIPVISALTLAMVGHDGFAERVGINARYASIGNAGAAALLGLWATWLSQRGVLLLTAAMAVPALVSLLGIRGADLRDPPREDDHAAHLTPKTRRQAVDPGLHIVWERGFLAFAGCAMLFQLANAAMLPLALNRYVANAKDSDWIISACIVVPQLVVAALSPLIGRLANYWGRRPVLVIGLLALPLRGVLLAMISEPTLLIPIELLDGLSGAVFGLMLPLIAADVSRRIGCLNLAIGGFNLAVGLGATVSTTLAGVIADRIGIHMALLALAAAGGAAVILVWMVMPETRPVRQALAARAVVSA